MKLDPTRTPDDVYANLPEAERVTAQVLRELIFETVPDAREKLSWGAPFYFRRRSFAFVWPASVPWGKINRGVALGFSRADLLDHGGRLGPGRIGRITYPSAEDIDPAEVMRLLRAAAAAAN